MSDIVERLRAGTNMGGITVVEDASLEAADEIERLRAEVAALKDTLAQVAHNIASSPAKVLEESVLVGEALNRLDKLQQALKGNAEPAAYIRHHPNGNKELVWSMDWRFDKQDHTPLYTSPNPE